MEYGTVTVCQLELQIAETKIGPEIHSMVGLIQ